MAHFIISTAPYRAPGAMEFSATQKVVRASKAYPTKAVAKSVAARSYRHTTAVVCEFETREAATAYADEVQALIN